MITDKQTRISDFLSREEISQFSQRSNLWGLWCIFSVWLIIGLAFTVMALAIDYLPWYFAIPVVCIGTVVLGGAIWHWRL